MASLTNEQIEQKKQQLMQLSEEINAIAKELQEASAWPLSDDELDNVAGGTSHSRPSQADAVNTCTGGISKTKLDGKRVGVSGSRDGIFY